MADRRLWRVVPVLFIGVLCVYASHTYEHHQAYKTGAYIGRTAFHTAEYQNRVCSGSSQPGCDVRDLNDDSTMEQALASANIIPSIMDRTEINAGFRNGWREARSAAFAGRVK